MPCASVDPALNPLSTLYVLCHYPSLVHSSTMDVTMETPVPWNPKDV